MLFAGFFEAPISAMADAPGDPGITDFVMDPTRPAPKSEVDFLVAFTNYGAGASKNVSLVVDFEENVFKQIIVGDPNRCANTGVTVVCNISSLDPGANDSIGFTGLVAEDAKVGQIVKTYAAIDESGNPTENKQNDFKEFDVVIGDQIKTATTSMGTSVSALIKDQKTLDAPSDKQGINLLSVSSDPNWEVSSLFTAGLKFMIRGKEALAWTLGINDSGFHNEAIQQTYLKVLTIVNSFFIIGLLIIAAMWMFSLLIPRRYLRQVMLVYGLAVVFVNFALPINQLLIDGTGLLQKSFMDGVNITNIVQLPSYDDKTAVGYQNKTDFVQSTDSKKLNLNITNADTTNPIVTDPSGGVVIGKIQQGFLQPTYSGTISTKDGNETVQLNSTGADVNLTLNPKQSIELASDKTFNPNEEQSIFAFLMLIFTGLAYLGMALIFILRIVILWALMITSPVLFLLCIFHWTRSYFINWLGVYAKWLLIGPLMALGIAIVVNIWKAAGLPITSTYVDSGGFGVLTNIGFYLPGSTTVNTLSNTSEMMSYLMFLVMLYMPIIFSFILTRQKLWSRAAEVISEKRESIRKNQTATQAVALQSGAKEEKTMAEAKSLTGGIRGFFGSQIARLNKPSMPEAMKLAAGSGAPYLESATSFLPQHLALTSMRDMINLTAGEEKGSRNAHEKAVENLSNPESIIDKTERQQVTAVRQEISQRAENGDVEAIRVMSEIHEKEELVKEKTQVTNNEITREKIEAPITTQKSDVSAIDKKIEDVMKKDIEKEEEKEQDEEVQKEDVKTKKKERKSRIRK